MPFQNIQFCVRSSVNFDVRPFFKHLHYHPTFIDRVINSLCKKLLKRSLKNIGRAVATALTYGFLSNAIRKHAAIFDDMIGTICVTIRDVPTEAIIFQYYNHALAQRAKCSVGCFDSYIAAMMVGGEF